MKMHQKKLALLNVFLALAVTVFADENNFLEIHGLLKNGLDKNYELIAEKASLLSPAEKLFLLDVHEKSMGIPFAVNFLAGFGIGSYMQGDNIGGTVQLSGQLLGLAGILAAAFMTEYDEDGYYEKMTDEGTVVAITGTALFYIARLYGCISPFVYGTVYNKKLKNALQYYSVSYNIVPSIDENGNGEIMAMLSIKF
jgi:hypothetical protein